MLMFIRKSEKGVTLLEYSLLALLLTVVVIGSMERVGTESAERLQDPKIVEAFE